MPLHKLNQAKNTSCHLKKNKKTKKLCTFPNVSFFFLNVSPPIYKPQICAQTHTCARVAHTGTFRQANVSLAGVKLWHLAVCVCTCNYTFSK